MVIFGFLQKSAPELELRIHIGDAPEMDSPKNRPFVEFLDLADHFCGPISRDCERITNRDQRHRMRHHRNVRKNLFLCPGRCATKSAPPCYIHVTSMSHPCRILVEMSGNLGFFPICEIFQISNFLWLRMGLPIGAEWGPGSGSTIVFSDLENPPFAEGTDS